MKSPKQLEELTTLLMRLKEHPRATSFDIAASNQAIVLPVLQKLDWDISNVDEVAPEFSQSGHAIYYTLRIKNTGLIYLTLVDSTKSPDSEPDKFTVDASRKSTRLFATTNGRIWSFFHVNREGEKWWSFLNSKSKNEEQIARKFITLDLTKVEARELATLFHGLLSKEQVQSGAFDKLASSYYEESLREQKLEESLPEAWNQLIREPGQSLVDIVASGAEKITGFKPESEEVLEFIKRQGNRLILPLPEFTENQPNRDVSTKSEKYPRARPTEMDAMIKAVLSPEQPKPTHATEQLNPRVSAEPLSQTGRSNDPFPTVTAEKARPAGPPKQFRTPIPSEQPAPTSVDTTSEDSTYSSILMNWARKLANNPRFAACYDKKAMEELLREIAGKEFDHIPVDEIIESAGNIYFFTIRPNLRKS